MAELGGVGLVAVDAAEELGVVVVEVELAEEPVAAGDDEVVEVGEVGGPAGVGPVEVEVEDAGGGAVDVPLVGGDEELGPADGEGEVGYGEVPCSESVVFVLVHISRSLHLHVFVSMLLH